MAVLLTAIVGIGALSIDIFLPSLPTIVADFNSRDATVQLSITLFLAAFALAQLFFGPVSDRFGRRPVLLGGLALYVVGTVLCFFAPTVEVLIAARMVQGIGAGSGPVVGRAIVRDVYSREQAARVFALMGTAQALTPILAPMLGGFLHEAFGWHSVFIVLTAFGAVFLSGSWGWVPESIRARDRDALRPATLMGNVWRLVTDRTFAGYVLVVTVMFCGQFAFITGSAFVLIGVLHLSPDGYGMAFGFVAFGIMIGSYVAARYASRLGIQRVIFSGTCLAALAGSVMAALVWTGSVTALGVVLPMFGFAVALGLIMPSAMAGAIGPFPQMAGLASAVIGCLMLTGSAGYSIAVSALYDGSARPMTSAIAVTGWAAFACSIWTIRTRRQSD